jgi:ATP-dependent DNA helicase RecG
MLFSDRLEIWNPGSLPLGWTTEKLKQLHSSVPANPLMAEPMYLAGYIERLGTGTKDMVRIAVEVGLREPDYVQEDSFKAILYRPSTDQAPTKLRPSTDQVPTKYRRSSVVVP